MSSFDLIIPFAAQQTQLSFLLQGEPDKVSFVQSVTGIHPERFNRIIVTLLAEDAGKWDLERRIREGFEAHNLTHKLTVLCLLTTTESQPETIAETLRQAEIDGAFWVKDPDNYFRADPIPDNVVTVFPLDALTHVNPQNKSYVSISDGEYILNLAEKRIIGRYFCTGGYGFSDNKAFLSAYEKLKPLGKLYLSHIIYQMLLDGILFRPLYVTDYQDWGTVNDWKEWR